MKPQPDNSVARIGRAGRVMCALLCTLATSTVAWAQDSGTISDVDRTFQFIDEAARATELYNQEKHEEALAIFESLLRSAPELDEDGYVGMAAADCLARLGRTDDARHALQEVSARHPELASDVEERLWDLELTPPITDETLQRLRAAAAANQPSFATYWRLGRALQQRAVTFLAEAGEAFRTAAQPEPQQQLIRAGVLQEYAEALAELHDDLSYLIRQTERLARMRSRCSEDEGNDTRFVTESATLQQVVRNPAGKRYDFTLKRETPGTLTVTVDGREFALTPAQERQFKRHQEHINRILVEAADGDGNVAPSQ